MFLLLLFGGGAAWWLISYIVGYAQNYSMVFYPQYAAMPTNTFVAGFVSIGFFVICLIPAIIYLWNNTTRPN
jgi:hypothetical protein